MNPVIEEVNPTVGFLLPLGRLLKIVHGLLFVAAPTVGLALVSHLSDLDSKVIQKLKPGAQLVNTDNQDDNQDGNCCPLAMQFGPARALQSKLVLAATEETYLSSCWYGGRQPASCERVLTPSTTGTAVSFPRNAAADCCSNSFTVQLLLRQVVRRNCESVHSRSAGRSQASE